MSEHHILIVDDEPHVIRVLELSLKRAGFTVSTANNGAKGIEQIRARHPDAVITDIQMPEMDGQQLCAAITAEFPERTFPIFMMTSRTEAEYREWAEQIRDLHFMEKPLSPRRVVDLLHRTLAAHEQSQSD